MFTTSKASKCFQNSDCGAAEYYCDTAINHCDMCENYPCHGNVIANQGDRMCKLQCPEHWKTLQVNMKTFTEDITQAPTLETESGAIKLFQGGELGPEEIAIIAVSVGMLFIILVVLTRVLFKNKGKRICTDVEACGLGPKKAIEEEDKFIQHAPDTGPNNNIPLRDQPNTELQTPILVQENPGNEGDREYMCLDKKY